MPANRSIILVFIEHGVSCYRRDESTDHNLRSQTLSFIYLSISCSVNYTTNVPIGSLARNRETSITPLCPDLSELLIKYIWHDIILYTRAYNIIIIYVIESSRYIILCGKLLTYSLTDVNEPMRFECT